MEPKNDFVAYLESLKDERGKLAALRRGLGLPPGTCAAMYPLVASRLPRDCPKELEERCYLVAALFGYHPISAGEGNLGDHMRKAGGDQQNDAVERRFTRLLAAHTDDLADELRQAISFLKSKDQGVNWQQLFRDLASWGHPERFIQRKWANAYWGNLPKNEKDTKVENKE